MNSSGKYNVMSMAYERSMSLTRFHRHPSGWIGKWMAGGIVYGLYMAIRFALLIWYHYFFLPWRDR